MSNKFYGEGNLGADPELKSFDENDDDKAVCNLRVYFDKPVPLDDGGFEDRGGFWLNVEIWGKRGITCSEVLKKGKRIYAEGSLIEKTWEDGNGEGRSSLVLRAKRVNPDISSVDSLK